MGGRREGAKAGLWIASSNKKRQTDTDVSDVQTCVNILERNIGVILAVATVAVLQNVDVVGTGRNSDHSIVTVFSLVVHAPLFTACRVVAAADTAPI